MIEIGFWVASIYELNALPTVLSSEIGVISLNCTIIIQQFSTTKYFYHSTIIVLLIRFCVVVLLLERYFYSRVKSMMDLNVSTVEKPCVETKMVK